MSAWAPRLRWGHRRAVERAAADLVAGLDFTGAGPTLGDMIELLVDRTGRQIRLMPADFGTSAVFGMVVRIGHGDVVMFDRATPGTHQLFTVFHELGHVILDHRLAGPDEVGEGATCTASSGDERAAEYFAARLSHLLRVRSVRAADPGTAADRITDTLAGGRIWK